MSDALINLRRVAIKCLTRREYSQHELRIKLQSCTDDVTLIEALLDELAEKDWQSDRRYAEMHTKTRLQQGYGPLRIQQELQAKQIKDDDIHIAFKAHNAFDDAWINHSWQKKFRAHVPRDVSSWQKQVRFLLYRGFSSEVAQQWLRRLQTEEGLVDNEMV